MKPVELLELESRRWLDFVSGRPDALPFHRAGWARTVAEPYGFRTFAAVVEDDFGEIVAGIPLAEARKPWSRRPSWTALPFTDRCPPLATDAVSERALLTGLDDLRRTLGLSAVEIRSRQQVGFSRDAGVIHRLDLRLGLERVRSGFSRSQVERQLRRAEREGVLVHSSTAARDVLETFYRLHVETRRRQGVPVQPRSFFRALAAHLAEPDVGEVLIAEVDGRAAAAAVFLASPGTVVYKFGASDPSLLDVRPNHPLFLRAIERAIGRGATEFDFGKTDTHNAGLRRFKSSWGASEEPLTFTVLAEKAPKRAPATPGLAARVIRHSPPWVARAAGALLYRYAA